jgi:hypothetical protein
MSTISDQLAAKKLLRSRGYADVRTLMADCSILITVPVEKFRAE